MLEDLLPCDLIQIKQFAGINDVDNGNANGYHSYMRFQSSQNSVSKQKPEDHTSPSGGRVTSDQLLGERSELIINHDGREYRLRLTQKGKLILTA